MRVKIYTYAYNRPEFISLQLMTFTQLLQDDFEYIVFNNAKKDEDIVQTAEVCQKLGVKWIKVEECNHSTANYSHATALNWSFHNHIKGDKGTISVILDFDMFLTKVFSINEYLRGYDLSAVAQGRGHVNYLWPGIMFFNMDTLPNQDSIDFMCDRIEGFPVDVGGHLYYWLKNNPDLRIRTLVQSGTICEEHHNMHYLPTEIHHEYQPEFKFEMYTRAFLHYGRGSNWDWQSAAYHQDKNRCLEKFLALACEKREVIKN